MGHQCPGSHRLLSADLERSDLLNGVESVLDPRSIPLVALSLATLLYQSNTAHTSLYLLGFVILERQNR